MDKRYQVFVSSTYTDLIEERQKVTQTLMEMDCIPAGMELFPAADEEQWEFIKKVINDCDYYLLIIGGRYGSITEEGISYTEKEYDYAVELGLKVIALLHGAPEELVQKEQEISQEHIDKLNTFREKVSKDRLIKYWNSADDLPGMVALSLQKTIKVFPAVGWVRANAVSNEDLLSEINELRKVNNKLKDKIADMNPPIDTENLASIDDQFEATGTYTYYNQYSQRNRGVWTASLSWSKIFALISPYLAQNPNQTTVKSRLEEELFKMSKAKGSRPQYISMDDQIFQTITIQFKALGLIKTRYSKTVSGSMGWFWTLTPRGEQLMFQVRAVKK